MLDFTYRCRGCGHDFSLLVGDPRAELCPGCRRAVREDLTAEFSVGIIEGLGRENAERPPPDPEALYDELVGALLDLQDGLSARAPPVCTVAQTTPRSTAASWTRSRRRRPDFRAV